MVIVLNIPNAGIRDVEMAVAPRIGETVSYNGFQYRVTEVKHTVLNGGWPLSSRLMVNMQDAAAEVLL